MELKASPDKVALEIAILRIEDTIGAIEATMEEMEQEVKDAVGTIPDSNYT